MSDDILGITFKVDENIEQGVFDFGLVASAGYNIYNNLFVDLRFYMGLVEMFPDAVYIGSDDITSIDDSDSISFIDLSGAKMMKFKVGLSYWFK